MKDQICPSCGDTYGSRYHEVAHLPDVETVSLEELAAANEIMPPPKCQGAGMGRLRGREEADGKEEARNHRTTAGPA